MKGLRNYLLACTLFFSLIGPASVFAATPAVPSNQPVTLDGSPVKLAAYNVDGNNYVKLRDIAAILRTTESSFDVSYDYATRTVTLQSKQVYAPQKGDLAPIAPKKVRALMDYRPMIIDGRKDSLRTAMIKDNNYIQLRDLSRVLDFRVDYDAPTRTVQIYTTLRERLKGKIDDRYLMDRFYTYVEEGLSYKEAELAERINEYRVQLGLPEFLLSKSLTTVARTHITDSNRYHPENQIDARGIKGNLHSWSSNGSWTPMAYTDDHAYAKAMWDKPRELTSYRGSGFEIAYWTSGYASPKGALAGWKSSPGHNGVIVGQGNWRDLTSMGVGIDGNYAFVWFGKEVDPAGYYGKTTASNPYSLPMEDTLPPFFFSDNFIP